MQERRTSVRRVVNVPGRILDQGGAVLASSQVLDISAGGAKLSAQGKFPDEFILVLTGNGQVRRGCHVVWRNDSELGVRFGGAPPPPSHVEAENTPTFID